MSAIDVAAAVVNRVVTLFVRAAPLPGLALLDGVPEALRTIVVVPTMLIDDDEIVDLVERLAIHFLASAAGDLHFALLSDWVDADAALLACAQAAIARLNTRYGPGPT